MLVGAFEQEGAGKKNVLYKYDDMTILTIWSKFRFLSSVVPIELDIARACTVYDYIVPATDV